LHATPAQRANWRLIGVGAGIHWPDLVEDISAEGLLAGRRSGETSKFKAIPRQGDGELEQLRNSARISEGKFKFSEANDLNMFSSRVQ
jgi:hypothetical protein